MTGNPNFDQKSQSVNTQTNIDHANEVIIQRFDSAVASRVPPQVRRLLTDIKGREDEMKDIIGMFDSGVAVVSVRGLGGVGKTALALAVSNQLKDQFSDGQIYLNLLGTSKSPLKPEDAMTHIIHSYLGLNARLPADQNGLGCLYCTVLSGKRALILLDNAASREQVEPLLPPVGSALLITSRNKFALAGLKEIDLNILPIEDAKNLLLEISRRIGGHAGELAKLCGCLPLALRNAAYALKEKPNLSVANYIKRLGDARKRLELVEASFDLSYQLLTPELQKRWSLLSVFPADFDLAGAAAVWEMEQIPAEDVLGELIKWSLVEFLPDATEEGGRYRLHDLSRDFAGSCLNEADREAAHERHAEHYMNVLSNANEQYIIGKEKIFTGLYIFDIERTNIFAGQAWAAKHSKTNAKAASLCSAYPSVGFYLLTLRQHPNEQIRWLEPAINAARQSADQKSLAFHLGRIGRAYSHLGKYPISIECFELAIAIAKEVGDRSVEGWAFDNMGSVYRKLGDEEKAIDYCQRHLKIAREIGDKRGEGTALGNIGQAYFAEGDNYEAIHYYNDQLKIVQINGNKRGERDANGNLGNAYASLGDFKKAFDYYEKAREISEEMQDCRGIGDVLGNMGKAYFTLGEYDKAVDHCERALKASRKIGDIQREAQALFTLGNVSAVLGQRAKAIDLAKAALTIFEQVESPHADQVREQLAQWQGDESPKTKP